MDTDPKSQSKTPSKHPFSRREFQLLYHRLDPTNNGIRSAALAGFKGSRESLSGQASRTLRKARECGFLATVLNKHGCTLERAAERLSACLAAQRKRAFLTNDGTVLYAEPEEDYGIQMRALELVLKLHGAFDSKRQEEVLLAEVADAMGLVEQEQPADTTSEVAHDEELSHPAAPENHGGSAHDSSVWKAGEYSEAPSESGLARMTSPNNTATSLPGKRVDDNQVAGQSDDPRAILLSVFADTHRDLLRARERQEKGEAGDTSKLVRDLCMLAATISKLGSDSEGQKNLEEITRPDHLSPEEQQLEIMADQMNPASRVFTGQALQSALQLASLKQRVQELEPSLERQPTAPPEDKS
jgi:hypothetical protein